MPRSFYFEAIDCRGIVQSGSIDASNKEDAETRLKWRGLFVTRLDAPKVSVNIRNLRSQSDQPFRPVIVVCEECAKELGATTEMRTVTCSQCGVRNHVVWPLSTS